MQVFSLRSEKTGMKDPVRGKFCNIVGDQVLQEFEPVVARDAYNAAIFQSGKTGRVFRRVHDKKNIDFKGRNQDDQNTFHHIYPDR